MEKINAEVRPDGSLEILSFDLGSAPGITDRSHNDAFAYNWRLKVPQEFQEPFHATHDAMGALEISKADGPGRLAVNLRRVFSGIVAGNVREAGIRAVEQHGPFAIHGDQTIMAQLDKLLGAFVQQNRMKLPGKRYEPCYRIIK
jgi:hypothetical protein